MSDAKIKQILSSLSFGIGNVSFLHDAYLHLEAYGNSGPLAAEVARAMKRIRLYSARQVELYKYLVLTPDNAVDFDVYLNILEKAPQRSEQQKSEIHSMRESLAPYLEKFDDENDISSVNENTDINSNADAWNKVTSSITPVRLCANSNGSEQYRIIKGFEDFKRFFSSIDKNTYSEIINLARVEVIQSLSKSAPSADRKANREAYIAKMAEVIGQISVELLHEYKYREFENCSSSDKSFSARDTYLDQNIKNQFNANTFADRKHLKAALATITCTHSAHVARVATRLQIKSHAKDIWYKVYEWDAKMTKKHPLLYPAAKSVTISLTTGIVGSIAYSGYKLEKAVRRSVINYKQNADKSKYENYFRYITAKENFNEMVDLGKSAALIAVSGIFAGSIINEHGLNAATGLVGHISEQGAGGLISANNASSGLINKLRHLKFSSFGKSLLSNSRVWASSVVSVSAGVTTGINTSMQQHKAELELDELLKLQGATKFPHDKETLKLRSSDPEAYYTLVIKNNRINLPAEDQKIFAEKASFINQKRREKKKRGWSSGLGTAIGLAGAAIFGSGSGKAEFYSNNDSDINLLVENNTNLPDHTETSTLEPETSVANVRNTHVSASNIAAFSNVKGGTIADNDEITVGEKLRIMRGEHRTSVITEHTKASDYQTLASARSAPLPSKTAGSNNDYGTDTDENKLISEKIREHTSASGVKKTSASVASNTDIDSAPVSEVMISAASSEGFTQSSYGLSYKIDDDGSIIFKGGIPDDETAAKIEAEAFANIKNAVAEGKEISAGNQLFMNEYAYSNEGQNASEPDFAFTKADEISEPNTEMAENTQTEQVHANRVPRRGRARPVIEDDVYYHSRKITGTEQSGNTHNAPKDDDRTYTYRVSKGFYRS